MAAKRVLDPRITVTSGALLESANRARDWPHAVPIMDVGHGGDETRQPPGTHTADPLVPIADLTSLTRWGQTMA